MKNWQREKKIIKNKVRVSILRILKNIQNERPDTVIYLNVFNTGFVIDSLQVRNSIIKVIRSFLK